MRLSESVNVKGGCVSGQHVLGSAKSNMQRNAIKSRLHWRCQNQLQICTLGEIHRSLSEASLVAKDLPKPKGAESSDRMDCCPMSTLEEITPRLAEAKVLNEPDARNVA